MLKKTKKHLKRLNKFKHLIHGSGNKFSCKNCNDDDLVKPQTKSKNNTSNEEWVDIDIDEIPSNFMLNVEEHDRLALSHNRKLKELQEKINNSKTPEEKLQNEQILLDFQMKLENSLAQNMANKTDSISGLLAQPIDQPRNNSSRKNQSNLQNVSNPRVKPIDKSKNILSNETKEIIRNLSKGVKNMEKKVLTIDDELDQVKKKLLPYIEKKNKLIKSGKNLATIKQKLSSEKLIPILRRKKQLEIQKERFKTQIKTIKKKYKFKGGKKSKRK